MSDGTDVEGEREVGRAVVDPRRRSSLHRLRVRRLSEAPTAAAAAAAAAASASASSNIDDLMEVVELLSSEEEEEEGEEEDAGSAAVSAAVHAEDEEYIIVEEDEGDEIEDMGAADGVGGAVNMADEGFDEGDSLVDVGGSQPFSFEAEEAQVVEALLPLAERLRRRMEGGAAAAAAGGGGGSGSGSGSGAAPSLHPPSSAAATSARAAIAPVAAPPLCACCASPVPAHDVAEAWLSCPGCGAASHVTCLAEHFVVAQAGAGVSREAALLARIVPTPSPVACPTLGCAHRLQWPLLVEEALRRGLKPLSPAQLREALALAPVAPAAQAQRKKRKLRK